MIMKKISFLFLLFAVTISCQNEMPTIDPTPESQEETNPEISEDSVFVKLSPSFEFESEHMTRATTTNDLYGIRVYQLSPTGMKMVAYGTFDDIEKAVIKMSKEDKYGIDLTYIANGKNLVHQFQDGHYGVPFDVVWNLNNGSLNQVVYYTNEEEGPIWPLSYGVVQEKGITDYKIQSNNWSQVTRYQGIAMCNPSEESTVEINMYAQMIGFKLSISEFEKGSVTLCGTYGHQYKATPDANNSAVIDIEVCLESMPSIAEEYYTMYFDENIDIVQYINDKERVQSVKIIYNDGKDDMILYDNINFLAKRNTRYLLSFSMSDAITNAGIKATVVDEGGMEEKAFPF